jgi:hypothetical protein
VVGCSDEWSVRMSGETRYLFILNNMKPHGVEILDD